MFEKDLVVNCLTHKWFDIKENRMRKTVIKDGVNAIQEAFANGNIIYAKFYKLIL